jgi:uncharacterized protein (TIGR02118 family)
MIRASVFYPNTPGAKFDHKYYKEKHCPMVAERLKPFGCVRIEIDKGLTGGNPDELALYVAMGHIIIESVEGLQQGLATHGGEIFGDVPNYTNLTPIMQISEVVA